MIKFVMKLKLSVILCFLALGLQAMDWEPTKSEPKSKADELPKVHIEGLKGGLIRAFQNKLRVASPQIMQEIDKIFNTAFQTSVSFRQRVNILFEKMGEEFDKQSIELVYEFLKAARQFDILLTSPVRLLAFLFRQQILIYLPYKYSSQELQLNISIMPLTLRKYFEEHLQLLKVNKITVELINTRVFFKRNIEYEIDPIFRIIKPGRLSDQWIKITSEYEKRQIRLIKGRIKDEIVLKENYALYFYYSMYGLLFKIKLEQFGPIS